MRFHLKMSKHHTHTKLNIPVLVTNTCILNIEIHYLQENLEAIFSVKVVQGSTLFLVGNEKFKRHKNLLPPYFRNKSLNQHAFKGIVHLNIIFSYMKFNKICNLDQPVYQNYLCWFSATCISEHCVFCIITHTGDSILKKTVSTFSKCLHERFCVQYYNMDSFPVWLQIQYGQMLLFLNRLQIFFEQLYFRLI